MVVEFDTCVVVGVNVAVIVIVVVVVLVVDEVTGMVWVVVVVTGWE